MDGLEETSMKGIELFKHGDKLIYSSKREVIAVYPNTEYEEYLGLQLSKRILENVDIFWSETGAELFNDVTRKTRQITDTKSELDKVRKTDGENDLLYQQLASSEEPRIQALNDEIVQKIQSFLTEHHIKNLSDLISGSLLNDKYIDFFKNHVWFEIFIYGLFKHLDFSDETVLLNSEIMGKGGLKHKIDITVVTPMHITIVEAKSQNVKRAQLMNLIGQKADINADLAFLIAGKEFSEKKEFKDKYRNVFVFDNVFDESFNAVLKKTQEKY